MTPRAKLSSAWLLVWLGATALLVGCEQSHVGDSGVARATCEWLQRCRPDWWEIQGGLDSCESTVRCGREAAMAANASVCAARISALSCGEEADLFDVPGSGAAERCACVRAPMDSRAWRPGTARKIA